MKHDANNLESALGRVEQKGIFVLGMHRSGTSVLSGVLEQCGVWIGEEEKRTATNVENPRGFFELRAVRNICDTLLHAAGADWWKVVDFHPKAVPVATVVESGQRFAEVLSDLGKHGIWAVKEPRLCLLYPLLAPHAPESVCILPVRNPVEVALSLRTRNGFSLAHGIALWEYYTRSALAASEGRDRVILRHDALISDPGPTIRRLVDDLSTFGVRGLSATSDAKDFVSPELRRENADDALIRTALDADQYALWQAVCEEQKLVKHGRTRLSARSLLTLRDLETAQSKRSEVESALATSQKRVTELTTRLDNKITLLNQALPEVEQIQTLLTEARNSPLHSFRTKFVWSIVRQAETWDGVFSKRRRMKFKRSALKRDPRRSEIEFLRQIMQTALEPVPTAMPVKPAEVKQPFDAQASERWKADLFASETMAQLQTNPPLVSIVMPTKNRAGMIGVAIKSVLMQSYDCWELIIVDDGSTDGTAEMIAQTFPDPRIKVISAERSGVSGARNTALTQAQGQIIAYLDSDNRWMPDYLKFVVLEMLRSGAKTAYAVLKGFRDGYDSTKGIFYLARTFDLWELKVENYIDMNVFVHHRDLYETLGGFDTNLRRMVDWDLIIRYCESHTPVFCNAIGVEYESSKREDRISVRETVAYQNVIRNKHWINWDQLSMDIAKRDTELVSVIICVYNNFVLTDACLTSLFTHQAGCRFEVILVDNGSDEHTFKLLESWAERHPQISLVRNKDNLNFALGNNIGFAQSKGSRVVFLNNDTEVTPEWLSALVHPLEDCRISGVQPKLLYPDGTVQCMGLVFSDRAPFAYGLYTGVSGDHPLTKPKRHFRAITAACMGLRAQDFIKVRGFDPIYVNGQEDVDLCLRIADGERAFTCANESVVIHHEGKTSGRGAAIPANRKNFRDRWAGHFAATDAAHYAEDNLQVEHYWPDSKELEAQGIANFIPVFDVPVALGTPLVQKVFDYRLRIPCPNPQLRNRWGDYHFAVALARSMARQGVTARIDFLESWDTPAAAHEIDFVLRGLSKFPRVSRQSGSGPSAVWIISHPDKITDEELEGHEVIFVASDFWAGVLRERGVTTPVVPLLQCTEAERFSPTAADQKFHHERLFVGNSRKVLRSMVARAIQEDLPIDIYGEMWEGLAPAEWLRAENIPNHRLAHYYASAGVVLNDHWDSMRDSGFVSNRVFDVLASGSPLVTDSVEAMPIELRDTCAILDNQATLKDTIERAKTMHSAAQRKEISNFIREQHSFNARSHTILEKLGTFNR